METPSLSPELSISKAQFGGDGSDVLEVKNASDSDARFGAGGQTEFKRCCLCKGATIAMGAGGDKLQLDKAVSSLAHRSWRQGADTITISATTDDSDGVKVDFGAGSDTLKLDLAGGDNVQVVGAAGNDYVIQSAGELDDSASILQKQ